jgi:hypothetical protein
MSESAAARHDKALELHLAGASYQAIADALGYASKGGAYGAVQEALMAAQPVMLSDEAVRSELARLDAMLTGLWPKARRGDVQAVDRVLKIGERRSALLSMGQTPGKPEAERTGLDELRARRAGRRPTADSGERPGGG